MRLLASKGEEVHWGDELCCEEKGSGRQSPLREGGGGRVRGLWRGGWDGSIQAGRMLGSRCSNQTALSQSPPAHHGQDDTWVLVRARETLPPTWIPSPILLSVV